MCSKVNTNLAGETLMSMDGGGINLLVRPVFVFTAKTGSL